MLVIQLIVPELTACIQLLLAEVPKAAKSIWDQIAQLGVLPCGRQPQCPIYPSAGPAKYVLELNAGQAQSLNLKPGDELRFGGFDAESRP